jgi:Zn-finger nucleic acid-binding protein
LRAAPCPGCGGFLEPQALDDVEIDVCTDCRGIWFDWFDGELTSLARRLEASTAPARATVITRAREHPCPRCFEELGADLVHGTEVLRCASCAGAFVDRAGAEALGRVSPSSESPSEVKGFARLAAWLREHLFGATAPRDD